MPGQANQRAFHDQAYPRFGHARFRVAVPAVSIYSTVLLKSDWPPRDSGSAAHE